MIRRQSVQRATSKQIRSAYEQVSVDSTFEFTVENVAIHDGVALVFGRINKGTICEGYTLRRVRDGVEPKNCVCQAIAGLTDRMPKASADGPEKNIGIWLDIPPLDVQPYDRIVSFDGPSSARTRTDDKIQFSILGGIKQ